MKSFKEYIEESQWMYHGTHKKYIDVLKPDRKDYMMDRAIGSHFAAYKPISDKFAGGLYQKKERDYMGYEKPKESGTVYRTRAPKRSELYKVEQKKYKHGGRQSDQYAIQNHIMSTVFQHDKDEFIHYVKTTRNTDEKTASDIHDLLSQGKAPSDQNRFGLAYHKGNSFRSYVNNYGSVQDQEQKHRIVGKYLDIMRSKGYKGLIYHNTSPMETEGLPRDGHRKKGEIGSKKSYVIFDPEHHPLEKIK